MKALLPHLYLLGWLTAAATASSAQEKQSVTEPVAFPKLEHYASLWKRSIFTTKDLPAPEEAGGPNFADNLSLSGIYEIDGGVVAVLVDRTTSQVMEARIGSENEMGVKIRQVTPGATVDKTRVQLQKGVKTGWVSFAEAAAPQPAEVVQRAVIPTRGGTASSAQTPPPVPASRQRRIMAPSPAASPNPILPPPAAPAPAQRPGDVPLPPP